MARQKQAIFRFYAELNDFLPKEKRQRDFVYHFWGNPAVKDAIEALGVPHPEVDLILVNQKSVDFNYRLQHGDRVAVYPVFELLDIGAVTHLRPKPLRRPKFILDCNLGKLTRKLRMLGFDCLYQNDYSDQQIVDMALNQKRIILTRDIGLLKNKAVTHGYWVRSTNPAQQLNEVLNYFDLFNQIQPFTRCLDCNGLIEEVPKKKIEEQLPARVRQTFNQFYRCQQCGKVYWQGSHYDRMLESIAKLRQGS
ncbi:MAG TPA: twitching motility protein PilT [Caldithrix abyssi]|uniref:Twitching motility protein PilT n=1 Tax=Caldithrix abyssi TaxID=187145 RepID=A0A7V5H310_CALAY|nr:twitching motility protein PilT [Caldithrix abyssi]